MKRLYQNIAQQHFSENRQMLFFAGPRQVGKTTIGQSLQALYDQSYYLNWDLDRDRKLLLAGNSALAESCMLTSLSTKNTLLILGEIHKYGRWKNLLKGFFDAYGNTTYICVTGSARLDVFRKGSDSLLGRYFPYRVHPLSVRELISDTIPEQLYSPPTLLDDDQFLALLKFGGFPEPFTRQHTRFSRQWNRMRENLLFKEDIRGLTQVQDIALIQMLATLLKAQAGQLLNMSQLAKKLQVSVNTVKRWLTTLAAFYYCYSVRPWTQNITSSLLKEPKVYLWNWADVEDPGARSENFIASHLLKAIHYWNDAGLGDFELYFLRTKDGKEVDFLVTKSNQPWFLVEVKCSENRRINSALYDFQQQTGAKHAFQVVIDMPYVERCCFEITHPIIVPAKTFLSQLV